jgi:hypothetical protein
MPKHKLRREIPSQPCTSNVACRRQIDTLSPWNSCTQIRRRCRSGLPLSCRSRVSPTGRDPPDGGRRPLAYVMAPFLKSPLSRGGAQMPLRTVMPIPGSDLLFGSMPGYLGEPLALGAKLLAVRSESTSGRPPSHVGVFVLFRRHQCIGTHRERRHRLQITWYCGAGSCRGTSGLSTCRCHGAGYTHIDMSKCCAVR